MERVIISEVKQITNHLFISYKYEFMLTPIDELRYLNVHYTNKLIALEKDYYNMIGAPDLIIQIIFDIARLTLCHHTIKLCMAEIRHDDVQYVYNILLFLRKK